jgi:hypothetical protein
VRRPLGDVLAAATAAGILGGAPSTLHALATGRDPLEATLAAGSMLLPREQRTLPLVVAAGVVHTTLSGFWGCVLARTLPRRATPLAGAAAGVGICLVDIGLVGRRFPRVRALPFGPQLADHLVFGAVAGEVIARRRAARELTERSRA